MNALTDTTEDALSALATMGIRPMPNQEGRWLSAHRPGLSFPSATAAAMSKTQTGARIDPLQDPLRPAYFMNFAANETPAEMALRKLACWLGVGGYNAPSVDAEAFHQKIVEGVQMLLQDAASQHNQTALDAAVAAERERLALRCEQVAAHDTHMTAREIALYLANVCRAKPPLANAE